MLNRRSLLGGLLGVLAAPAIVRTPGILMPIRPVRALVRSDYEKYLVAFDPANGQDATVVVRYEIQRFDTGFVVLDMDVERSLSLGQTTELVRVVQQRYDRMLAASMRPV